jgi:hypothetical protein
MVFSCSAMFNQLVSPRRAVSACLVFRNSARYLREWLLFHTAAGVDFFHLYDNDSEDDFESVIEPWIRVGRAELVRWSGMFQQTAIYDDCLERARRRGAGGGGDGWHSSTTTNFSSIRSVLLWALSWINTKLSPA